MTDIALDATTESEPTKPGIIAAVLIAAAIILGAAIAFTGGGTEPAKISTSLVPAADTEGIGSNSCAFWC